MNSRKLMKLLPGLCLALAGSAFADFDPVPLTAGSYNADVVVEKTAPRSYPGATTVSMDNGTENINATWYERGYNTTALTTGLPVAGSTFTHVSDATKSYTMPASYYDNCAVFLSNQFPTSTITFTTPASLTDLSFLSSTGGGAATISYKITFADSGTQTGTFNSADWFNIAGQAWTSGGRVNASTGGFDNVNTTNPRLYSQDVAVTSSQLITKVDLTWVSGGRCSVFAVSGKASGLWTPQAITGFNQDVVFGAGEASLTPLTTATTITMDNGVLNTANTFYESGYYRTTPNSGLPQANTVFTSAATGNRYLMPPSYAAPNAVHVDAATTTATITLATPLNYSALSLLYAAANGNVSAECTIHFQDGGTEVKTFTAKDWFNNTPFALNCAGRISVTNRTLNNHVNGTNPRLYDEQFALTNTVSPVVSIDLKWLSGGTTSRVAVFAVSATAGALKPVYGSVPSPVILYGGNSATFTASVSGGTVPFTYQWQKSVDGVFTNLSDGGNIAGATTLSLTVNPAEDPDQTEYRLVTTNVAGSTITAPVKLTVISSLPDITAPGDPITAFGGTAPAGEDVSHAIDNVGQKYLNFGSGPNAGGAPFVGPVGFVVTPVAGPTVVKGIRIYTANDTAGRDPVDFTLEGSNDGGTNWSPVATGPLTLPDGRNEGGGVALNPLAQFLQQILFSNTTSYTSYRVGFASVKEPSGVNSMQIAEVELLGTQPVGELSMVDAGDGQFLITSTTPGTLQSSIELTLWSDLGFISPGVPLLYVPAPGEYKKFFRLKP